MAKKKKAKKKSGKIKPSDLARQTGSPETTKETMAQSEERFREAIADPARYVVVGEDFCNSDLSRLCMTDRKTGRCYTIDIPQRIENLAQPGSPIITVTLTYVGQGWTQALLDKLRR